jgi:hypothetical protein
MRVPAGQVRRREDGLAHGQYSLSRAFAAIIRDHRTKFDQPTSVSYVTLGSPDPGS